MVGLWRMSVTIGEAVNLADESYTIAPHACKHGKEGEIALAYLTTGPHPKVKCTGEDGRTRIWTQISDNRYALCVTNPSNGDLFSLFCPNAAYIDRMTQDLIRCGGGLSPA